MQTPLQGAFRCVWMQNRVFLLMHLMNCGQHVDGATIFPLKSQNGIADRAYLSSRKVVPWKSRKIVVNVREKGIFVLTCSSTGSDSEFPEDLKEGNITEIIVHVHIELVCMIGQRRNEVMNGN